MHTDNPGDRRPRGQHTLHLYDGDPGLVLYLVSLLARPLLQAQPVLVVATTAHREQLAAALHRGGLHLSQLRDAGLYLTFDTGELLRALSVDGRPDRQRFHEVIGRRVQALAQRYGTVPVYGEMIAELWAAGDAAGALELERLWSDLARGTPISLACGFPSAVIGTRGSSDDVEQLFREHGELALV